MCVAIGIREQAGGGKTNTHARSWEDNSFSHLFLSVFDLYEIYISAIRARGFVLELLEFPGVELAVSQTRGWGELERLSTELQE